MVSQWLEAGVRAFGERNWPQAEALCRQVLAADPGDADAMHVLALVLRATGRPAEGLPLLTEAVHRQPWNASAWSNLGLLYADVGNFADAARCQQQAIRLREDYPEAHYNLSIAQGQLGQSVAAISSASRAIALRPDYAKAHFHLGNMLYEGEDYASASSAYQAALQLQPDWLEAHLHLAATWCELSQPDKAAVYARETLRLNPGLADAELLLARALRLTGHIAEAKAAHERAATAPDARPEHADPMSRLFVESLAEPVAPNNDAIAAYHARLKAALQVFAAAPGTIDLANLHTRAAAVPDMMLAYYGGDVRPIMEQYAGAIAPLIPAFSPRPRTGKPKLGIIVTDTHEAVFARCWGGIAERLSRERFDVRLACSRRGVGILKSMLSLPDAEYLILPVAVDAAAKLLFEQQFDWLHYWEIGTDQMNYYLSFFRAAAGQSACWGWPVTSGNPRVDAYLSCEQLEPPDGQSHYTERPVSLKHLPTYYVRPQSPSGELTKGRFGWQDRQHVYLCTQNLRKYHPNFDSLLAELLRTDTSGVLAIIADAQTSITELLLARFRKSMPDVLDRVRVVPRMERDEYLALVAMADVMLDTLHYGGGANTVYDAVTVGTPIITLPGEFHRGRWAAAVNRRLELPELIASSPQEYVGTAINLAGDADRRVSLRSQILEAGVDLFADQAVVSEHDEYFSGAISAVRAG